MMECRWEFKEIGQGHYHIDFLDCVTEAVGASRKRPDLTVVIEKFRPERKPIVSLKNGKLI